MERRHDRLGNASTGWLWSCAVGLMLLGALLLRLPLLQQHIATGADSWRQTDTASIARHFARHGFDLLYPQIYWGGDGPGYVETELQLYPFMVALVYAAAGERELLGRLVSLLFLIPTGLLFHRLARLYLPQRTALCALGFLLICPLYLRYSVAFMPEATVLFFYTAALYSFTRWLRDDRLNQLLWAALCTALAIVVKPTAIHIGLVFALLLLSHHGLAVLRRPLPWAFAVITLVPEVIFYFHARGLYLHYGNTFGVLSGGDSKFGSPRAWVSPALYSELAHLEIEWILGAGGLLLVMVGVAMAARRRVLLVPFGLATMFLYYLLVARYAREQWGVHYHLYAVPYYALAAGLGVEWLVRSRVGCAVAGLGLAGYIAHAALGHRALSHAPRSPLIGCAQVVAALVPPEARMIVGSTSPAVEDGVPNNYQNPVIFYLAERYGWSLARDQYSAAAVTAISAPRGGTTYLVVPEALHRQRPHVAAALLSAGAEPLATDACRVYRLPPGPGGDAR